MFYSIADIKIVEKIDKKKMIFVLTFYNPLKSLHTSFFILKFFKKCNLYFSLPIHCPA